MSTLDWAIAASAIGLIGFVNWFFLGRKDRRVTADATAPGGVVEVMIRVEGGYTPSTVEVPAGARVVDAAEFVTTARTVPCQSTPWCW